MTVFQYPPANTILSPFTSSAYHSHTQPPAEGDLPPHFFHLTRLKLGYLELVYQFPLPGPTEAAKEEKKEESKQGDEHRVKQENTAEERIKQENPNPNAHAAAPAAAHTGQTPKAQKQPEAKDGSHQKGVYAGMFVLCMFSSVFVVFGCSVLSMSFRVWKGRCAGSGFVVIC